MKRGGPLRPKVLGLRHGKEQRDREAARLNIFDLEARAMQFGDGRHQCQAQAITGPGAAGLAAIETLKQFLMLVRGTPGPSSLTRTTASWPWRFKVTDTRDPLGVCMMAFSIRLERSWMSKFAVAAN